MWRSWFLRFARHTTAPLIASLLLRRKRRVPVAPSVPSLCSSHDSVAHCFACLASQSTCVCGAVGSFASFATRQRRSLPRFSCVANDACLWRRRSLRFARHMAASLNASLLLRRKRRVPVAPSPPVDSVVPQRRRALYRVSSDTNGVFLGSVGPSLRSSYDGVAHCVAPLASQTTFTDGAVGPSALLVTRRRRSLVRFSCVANDV